MECCRDGCPSGRFSHLHRGTLELIQSNHWVLGHPPDQGPSTPIAQFGWAVTSRKSLCGSILLPFQNDGGHCVLGDLHCCITVLVPFPRSVPRRILSRSSTDNSLDIMAFALTCTDNCGNLYRQVCAFPNHVQSIEFFTSGLQLSCRNISRMINGNWMHLSSISSLVAKGLNTYVNKVFLFCFL